MTLDLSDVAGQLWRDASAVSTARDKDVVGCDVPAMRATHNNAPRGPFELQRLAMFPDCSANLVGSAGQSANKAQRLQLSAAAVETRGRIDLRAEIKRRGGARHHLRPAVTVITGEMFGILLQRPCRALIMRGDDKARLHCTIDCVFFDQSIQQRF